MPDGMVGVPGANIGGSQIAVPGPTTQNQTPSIGSSTTNPFVPNFPSGQSMFPANVPDTAQTGFDPAMFTGSFAAPSGLNNPVSGVGGYPFQFGDKDLFSSLKKMGFPLGLAGALIQGLKGQSGMVGAINSFINSGAGFNPEVANAMIAAMQPEVSRHKADLLEQFSGQGMRFGSPAAIGLGDYLSQVQLNEGQIWSQLYQNSVSNYLSALGLERGVMGDIMTALLGTRKQGGGNMLGGLGALIGGAGGAMTGIASLASLCWIAEAVYGKDDWRTDVVRWYMLNRAPKSMVWLYRKCGQRVAKWVEKSRMLKGIFKFAFDRVLVSDGVMGELCLT